MEDIVKSIMSQYKWFLIEKRLNSLRGYFQEARLGYKFYFYKRSNNAESFRAVKINHTNLVKKARAYSHLPPSH